MGKFYFVAGVVDRLEKKALFRVAGLGKEQRKNSAEKDLTGLGRFSIVQIFQIIINEYLWLPRGAMSRS